MNNRENRWYGLWFLIALALLAFGCMHKGHARDLG